MKSTSATALTSRLRLGGPMDGKRCVPMALMMRTRFALVRDQESLGAAEPRSRYVPSKLEVKEKRDDSVF